MTYIEPIQLYIEKANENLAPTTDDESINVPEWPEQYSYVFNKMIGDSYGKIDREIVEENVRELLQNLLSDMFKIDNIAGRRAQRIIESGMERGPLERLMILTKPNIILFTSNDSGLIFLISENKDAINNEMKSIIGKLNNFTPIADEFGLSVDILTGPEFAHFMSSSLDSEVESRDNFDNEFEKTVYHEITDNITESIDANCTLKFGQDDPEVFEYDLLLHATTNKRIVIEVKDESHDQADLGKSKLIDRPRDKTNIIGSNNESTFPPFRNQEQTETFVVVKDMDSKKLEQHRQKAERRNVNLLSYDGGEYLTEIEDIFKKMVYNEL